MKLKNELGFFETIRISALDFKSYIKFTNMNFLKVVLNRVVFVFLISLFYFGFLNKDIKILNDFNKNKQEIFKNINYSKGILNIENSPSIFKSGDFLLIGDTRGEFKVSEFPDYHNYKRSIVLLKDSFILRNKLKEVEIKYSDFVVSNLITDKNKELNKDEIFNLIELVSKRFQSVIYVIFSLFLIFNYFFLAFLTSFFAFFCSIIMRVKIRFSQVYKMVLFAQGTPFLIISIFEIIAKYKNINVLFPSHILEFLTLSIFLISIFSIKKDSMKKVFNDKK